MDHKYDLLHDGYPMYGELHDETSYGKYRIEVDMEAGFEKSIIIDVSDDDPNHDVFVYISYRKDPSVEDGRSDFSINYEGDKHIEIGVDSENFHRKGTYYIWVVPMNHGIVNSVWRYFTEDVYGFTIKYSLKGNFEFLTKDSLTYVQKQGKNTLRKFSYVIGDPTID